MYRKRTPIAEYFHTWAGYRSKQGRSHARRRIGNRRLQGHGSEGKGAQGGRLIWGCRGSIWWFLKALNLWYIGSSTFLQLPFFQNILRIKFVSCPLAGEYGSWSKGCHFCAGWVVHKWKIRWRGCRRAKNWDWWIPIHQVNCFHIAKCGVRKERSMRFASLSSLVHARFWWMELTGIPREIVYTNFFWKRISLLRNILYLVTCDFWSCEKVL